MKPLIDPRSGDTEDDISSTKKRKLIAIAGSMLAEISLPKFIVAWGSLVAVPGLVLGLAPLIATAWFSSISYRILAFSGLSSLMVLAFAAAVGFYGIRPLLRIAENSFWSLNSLAVQPSYALCREGLRHIVEGRLAPDTSEDRRVRIRAAIAAAAGAIICIIALVIAAAVWPCTRWSGHLADLAAPLGMIGPAIANTTVIVSVYFGVASLIWGLNDASMDQPRNLGGFDAHDPGAKNWRVVQLSDIHIVGERYGFRVESGRAGPRGNDRLARVFDRLTQLHQENPFDFVLITGDITDAGRSSEWAEFLELLARHPALAERTLILPGNHDVNVVDRANPARLELPMSPAKRLRHMRTLSAMAAVQGDRAYVFDREKKQVGALLRDSLEPHRAMIDDFADTGKFGLSHTLSAVWSDSFPLVVPPLDPEGLGIIILNSNAETNFSFTNALGLVPAEDVAAMQAIIGQFPQARWILALHHHLMEYPMAAKAFSERIGTALINGSWFVRQLAPLGKRLLIMHGHRHIDWIGRCGALKIVSAPSPVMEALDHEATCFYVHTLSALPDGGLGLMVPERIDIPGGEPVPSPVIAGLPIGKVARNHG